MNKQPKRHTRPGIDEYGRNPLWHLAASGDAEAVAREIASGANPNVGDDDGWTPLHIAVQNGHLEVIEILLSSGANPNAVDSHSNSPLWVAMLSAPKDLRIHFMRRLHASGSDPHHVNKHGRSPFNLANEIGHGYEKIFERA